MALGNKAQLLKLFSKWLLRSIWVFYSIIPCYHPVSAAMAVFLKEILMGFLSFLWVQVESRHFSKHRTPEGKGALCIQMKRWLLPITRRHGVYNFKNWPGSFAKPQMTGPQFRSFWASRSGLDPENLHSSKSLSDADAAGLGLSLSQSLMQGTFWGGLAFIFSPNIFPFWKCCSFSIWPSVFTNTVCSRKINLKIGFLAKTKIKAVTNCKMWTGKHTNK